VNESKGFIKLYRSVLEWEWFNDVNAFRLFMYCLLKANYTDTAWRGIDIERGSFVTSTKKLSVATGLSVQQTRTSLNKLISTGELTNKSHSKYSIITINNYDEYQENNKQINKRTTNNQQTDNKQITTDKEIKKETNKEVKNKYMDYVLLAQTEYDALIVDYGQQTVDEFIFRLNEYIGIKGDKYKNHNLVIRKWVRQDPKPKWSYELKSEQDVHDARLYTPKRSAEEAKRKLDEL